MKKAIKINTADNVAVVLSESLPKGTQIEGVMLLRDIPRGHKFALRDIAPAEPVIKYGFSIGHAVEYIEAGEWVHSHNLSTSLSDNLSYEYDPIAPAADGMPHACPAFDGYLRANGNVGVRNELWVIPTVGCVNGQCNAIVQRLREQCDLSGIDDVRALTHNYGCSQLGTDHANTRAALAAMAHHPNAGAILFVGLGCENNQIDALKQEIGDYDSGRVRFLVAQEVEDEVEAGTEICHELMQAMRADHRTPQPISKLKVGLKCGGSDGLSGITANPLVGSLSDRLIACGATTVLTEVPEMFGAETLLMNRAVDRTVFDKTVSLINTFKDYFRSYGQPIYENPSPGNKAGGITTLEEKSLGCVQKGGSAPVVDVLGYAQRVAKPGLNLLYAPGNDLVASTALALSGCQIVLFTTGRGTPFGTFVPTLKISTNTPLWQKKGTWIDFNAGALIEDADMEIMTDKLMQKLVSTANGQRTCNEKANAKEIAIFKTGVTL